MFSKSIKLSISLILIFILFYKANSSGSFEVISQVKTSDLLSAIVAHLFALGCIFIRWYLLLSTNCKCSMKSTISSYYIGFFANNFLPTSFGGDFVRASYLYKNGFNLNILTTTIVLDRVFGLIATSIILVASFYTSNFFLVNLINMELIFIITIFLIIITIVVLKKNNLIITILRTLHLNDRFINTLLSTKKNISQIFINRLTIILATVLSCTSILSVVICYMILSDSLNISISFAAMAFAITLSIISASLPISIGGLGIREGTLIFILTQFGVGIEQSISLSLLYLSVLLVISLPGGLFFITAHFSKNET